jgi:hypothetical protein
VVWVLPRGELAASFLPDDPSTIEAMRFAPDGRHLVTADRKGRLHVYPLETFAPPRWLREGPALAAEREVREVRLREPTGEVKVR